MTSSWLDAGTGWPKNMTESLVFLLHFTLILFARYLCNFVCYTVTYHRFKLLFDYVMLGYMCYRPSLHLSPPSPCTRCVGRTIVSYYMIVIYSHDINHTILYCHNTLVFKMFITHICCAALLLTNVTILNEFVVVIHCCASHSVARFVIYISLNYLTTAGATFCFLNLFCHLSMFLFS